jgi:hypothetical protein
MLKIKLIEEGIEDKSGEEIKKLNQIIHQIMTMMRRMNIVVKMIMESAKKKDTTTMQAEVIQTPSR